MNKEITPSEVSHISCLNSSDQFNNPVAVNQAHSTMQNSENVKLRNMNVMADMPITTDLSNNLNFIPTNNLSENMDYTRNFHSDDLLIKQSSSIKKIEKKLESLENKMKEFPTLKKKRNIYSCHHDKYKNNILLNPDLLTAIFKGMAQYHNEERQKNTCFKNKRNKFRKYKHNTRTKEKIKKRKRLKKYNTYEDSFLWKIECFDKNFLQDILCNKPGNAAKESNISQFEHDTSYKTIHNSNRNNSILDINTSGQSLNNEPVLEEPILFMKENPENISRLTETEFVKDNSVCSITNLSLINNEIPINHNLSLKDNAEYIDLDNQMTSGTTLSLPNSQNSIDHANKKIIMMESKIKRESKFKKGITNRLLRKIKNLKRETQVNSHMNKQENNKSFSHYNFEHNELTKLKIQETEIDNLKDNDSLVKISKRKRKSNISANLSINEQENIECVGHHGLVKKIRIAHIPKSSNITILETCQQNNDEDQRLDKRTQIQENILSIENEKNHIMKKKNEKNSAGYHNEMYNIDNGSNKKNSIKNRTHLNDNNFSSSDIDTKQTSMIAEFDKYDNVNGVMDASANILTEKVIAKISNTCDDSNVSCNILYNITKNLEFEKYTVSNTKVQFESPSSPCKDSEYDKCNENIERDIQIEKVKITEEMSDDEYTSDMTIEKNCNVYAMSGDTILHDDRLSILNRSNALEVLHHQSHDNIDHNISNTASRFQYLPMSKDNEIIEDCVSNNNKLIF